MTGMKKKVTEQHYFYKKSHMVPFSNQTPSLLGGVKGGFLAP